MRGRELRSWNGHVTGGDWAAAGRTSCGSPPRTPQAFALRPAAGLSVTALDRWGVAADLAAPTASGSPGRCRDGPRQATLQVLFSEAISGLSSSRVQLRVAGVAVPRRSAPVQQEGVTITPDAHAGRRVHPSMAVAELRDEAGNAFASGGWEFRVAPGSAYDPSRGGVTAGSHLGYPWAQTATCSLRRWPPWPPQGRLRSACDASEPAWPLAAVETGPLNGRWLRNRQRLRQGRGRAAIRTRDIALPAGRDPPGHRFGAAGAMT